MLREIPRWVLWRWMLRGGKWTKPPYQVGGRLAKSTEPTTWSSFDETLAAYSGDKSFDGIGFVLTDTDDIVGVDLDHCRDLEDGVVEPWAMDIIEQLDSYAEVSPSGTGIRVIAKGKLPPKGRKKGNFEIYV